MTVRRMILRMSFSIERRLQKCKPQPLFWIQALLGCTAVVIVVVLHTNLNAENIAKRTTRDNRIIERIMAKKISLKEKAILMDLVERFLKLADELNLVYFMSGGTLIGSWRHHAMITWDDDVDVLVDEAQKPALLAAIRKLEPDYFGPDTKPVVKFYAKNSTRVTGRNWSWPFIDISFFRQNDAEIWDTIEPFDKIKLKKDRIFPLHERPFEHFKMNAPKDSLHYFEETYSDSLAKCMTHTLSHERDKGGQIVYSIACQKLKHLVPFVHRRVVNNSMMEETLKHGDKVINVRLVEEDSNNLSGPYDLVRVRRLPWSF